MKRIICFALLLCLLVPVACAESIDLDSLSFQELAALRDRIQFVMMQRDEWQEVTVPHGVYKVGEDIPAGTWVVKCSSNYPKNAFMKKTYLTWGEHLNEAKTKIDYDGSSGYIEVYSADNQHYQGGPTELVITLKNGLYLVIDQDWNSAVFTPYTGKPDLGFK